MKMSKHNHVFAAALTAMIALTGTSAEAQAPPNYAVYAQPTFMKGLFEGDLSALHSDRKRAGYYMMGLIQTLHTTSESLFRAGPEAEALLDPRVAISFNAKRSLDPEVLLDGVSIAAPCIASGAEGFLRERGKSVVSGQFTLSQVLNEIGGTMRAMRKGCIAAAEPQLMLGPDGAKDARILMSVGSVNKEAFEAAYRNIRTFVDQY